MPFSTHFSSRTNRIVGSLFVASLLVASAYFFSGPSIFSHHVASAESTDDLLKSYAAKDSDGDGLPDWQEALYGTDPNKAISNQFGIPDGEAVSEGKLTPQTLKNQLPQDNVAIPVSEIPGVDPAQGSVTEQFSQQFLQAYMAKSNGQPLSDADQQALVSQLLANLAAESQPLFSSIYTKISVRTSSSETNLQYADAVERIFAQDDLPADSNNPVEIMQSLIINKDPSAKTKLLAVASMYRKLANDLLSTPAPIALTNDHLSLIQAFDSLNKSVLLIATYEKDPVGVMGALAAYTPASKQLSDAISDIGTTLLQSGEPAPNTPGYMLVSIGRQDQTQH